MKGFLKREEIEKLLINTDILLLPSVSEPFGLVILEAMACGAVPIIPKEAGAGELLKNPIKLDLARNEKVSRRIIRLLSNPGKLKRMKAKCIEEAKKIRWEDAAKKILHIYREVLFASNKP